MAKKKLRGVRATAAKAANAAQARVEAALAEDPLDEAYAYLRAQMRERPIAVAGAAAAFGLAIGLLLAGRR